MTCPAEPDIDALGALNDQMNVERHRGHRCVRPLDDHDGPMHWTGPGGLWFSDQWRLQPYADPTPPKKDQP